MGRCQNAPIASITRRNVFLPRSRKSAIHQKGTFCSQAEATLGLTCVSSAKYIEGLENRLGRMEHLLRLSGLLTDEDGDKTDLGTLEKRLAERGLTIPNGNGAQREARRGTPNSSTNPTIESRQSTPQNDHASTPNSAPTSPEQPERSEAEVENLSDMMCSLVTNNCGETRYIGTWFWSSIFLIFDWFLQDLRQGSPYSHPRAFSGSMRRRVTPLSKI